MLVIKRVQIDSGITVLPLLVYGGTTLVENHCPSPWAESSLNR